MERNVDSNTDKSSVLKGQPLKIPSLWSQRQTLNGSGQGVNQTNLFEARPGLLDKVSTLNPSLVSSTPKSVIRPIPSRLETPMRKENAFENSPLSFQANIKKENYLSPRVDEDGADSAFEDDSGCSRTTPINYNRIKKWRMMSESKSSSCKPISVNTTPYFGEPGPASAPSSLFDSPRPGSRNLTGSSGIGFSPRDSFFDSPSSLSLRESFESSSRSKCEELASPKLELVNDNATTVSRQCEQVPALPSTPKLNLDLFGRTQPADHATLPLTPWETLQLSSEAFRAQQALAASLPLGYQLAKFPLTGQMFFVPGMMAPPFAHTQFLWPPPSLSPGAIHHSLLQMQHDTWMAHQPFFYGANPGQLSGASQIRTPPPAHQLSATPKPVHTQDPFLEPGRETPVQSSFKSIKQENCDRETRRGNFLVDSLCSKPGETWIPETCDVQRAKSETKSSPDFFLRPEAIKAERKNSCDNVTEPSRSSSGENYSPQSGLHILAQGVEQHLSKSPAASVPTTSSDELNSKFRLLCDAALLNNDDLGNDERSPKMRSKSLDSHIGKRCDALTRSYSSPKAEKNAKAFIASKSTRLGYSLSLGNGLQRDNADEWEKDVRQNLADVQRKYKEKYKELFKLQRQNSKKERQSRSRLTEHSSTSTHDARETAVAYGSKIIKTEITEKWENGFKEESTTKSPKVNFSKTSQAFENFSPPHIPSNPLQTSAPRDFKPKLTSSVISNSYPASALRENKSATENFENFDGKSDKNHFPPSPASEDEETGNPWQESKTLETGDIKQPITVKFSKFDPNSETVRKKSKKLKKHKKEKRKEEKRLSHESKGHHEKKKKKIKAEKKEGPLSCVIHEDELREGLRVLVKLDGHFHPAKIQEISPPDIYGVLVDHERGNKPHIFSREEVLQDAIFEVRIPSASVLVPGTRVCAYWSHKYQHLYPGTVSDTVTDDPKLDENFVNVELDDGDSRDIHFENIRLLPENYPLVEYDPDPMASLSRRKRRQSYESSASEGPRSATKTPRSSIDDQSSRFSSYIHDGRKNLLDQFESIRKPELPLKLRVSLTKKKKKHKTLTHTDDKNRGMAAFLHPQQLWRWVDQGVKKPKSRRVIHKQIVRDDEMLSVGDCAVFLSTGRPDRPYIGRIEALWESSSRMRVQVRWFYHPIETKGCAHGSHRVDDIVLSGALFKSNHFDENDVQTISHRCEVVSVDKFKSMIDNDPTRLELVYENNDLYYLAGDFDPVAGKIQFRKGIFSSE